MYFVYIFQVALALEAGLIYVSLALVTDYDCWKTDNVVNVENVMKTMRENVENVKKLLVEVIPKIGGEDWEEAIRHQNEVARSSVVPGPTNKKL